MNGVPEYEKQVYAGLLGKVIGVYMGRPFEQWPKARIEEKWGVIDRYVHEDTGVPLVVSDDDLSGTMTFIRILEDAGLYAETPDRLFGENWLNYIMEDRTILWWGGNGMSTEHTAYLNLKNGIQAPQSGSMNINGQSVSEQIGAQIFIEGFGLVAPGHPDLAVKLARKAGAVSHDGEALHAASVVAAMVSAAFTEKDTNRLLDIGIGYVPDDALIYKVHGDVRKWCIEDGDWQVTFNRIEKKYGYACFAGTCHVIPNHALMVMAWCYAHDDFFEAQKIINTAGYDTDCNAANVGTVMGIKVGLDGINTAYDFQSPFADLLILPTAEGTYSISDVLNQASMITNIGYRVMGQEPDEEIIQSPIHRFSMPGALHGYQFEETDPNIVNRPVIENAPSQINNQKRCLRITYVNLTEGNPLHISTPIMPHGPGAVYGTAKQMQAVPRLYPGMTIRAEGFFATGEDDGAAMNIFIRSFDDLKIESTPVYQDSSRSFTLKMDIPDQSWPVKDIGFCISGQNNASGIIEILEVHFEGKADFQFPDIASIGPAGEALGWISDLDRIMTRPFPADRTAMTRIGNDTGGAVMVTGCRDWNDYEWQSTVNIHKADRAGLLVRYQGLRRYVAILFTVDTIQVVKNLYGESIIAEKRFVWNHDTDYAVRIICKGNMMTVFCDDIKIIEADVTDLSCGGAGYYIENGLAGFRNTTVRSC